MRPTRGRLRPQGVDAAGRRGRRQTEVDYLNGGIVRFGEEYGVPTPLNATIQALVKGVEASWTQS